jgi:hypothetical protein
MKGCGGKIGPFDCCTIILGKCEKYLPQIPKGAIDIVLTDPPYGKGLQSWREENGPIQGDDHFPVETIKRLIKIPRLASYLFCHVGQSVGPRDAAKTQERAGVGEN